MKKGCWWAIFGIGGVAFFAAVRIFNTYWDFADASNDLPAAIAAYRAEGLPWRASDVIVGPIPEERNAAKFLREALVRLPHHTGTIGGFDPVLSKAFETESIATILPEYRSTLESAHQAAQYPRLDFGWDLDKGLLLETPELSGIQSIVHLLGARAKIRAETGDDQGAIVDLNDARRLSALLGQLPGLIPAMVSVNSQTQVLRSAEDCVAAVSLSSPRLFRYRRWLTSPTALPDFHRALRGEIYSIIATVRNFDRMGVGRSMMPQLDIEPFVDGPNALGSPSNPYPAMRREGIPMNVRARAYMTRCLQLWTELSRETHGMRDDLKTLKQVSWSIQDQAAERLRMSEGFLPMLFPVFGSVSDRNRSFETRRLMLLELTDAILTHRQTGQWPHTLARRDPFGSGPLKIRFDGKHVIIWSIGPNQIDNRGLLPGETRKNHTRSDDLVTSYPSVR